MPDVRHPALLLIVGAVLLAGCTSSRVLEEGETTIERSTALAPLEYSVDLTTLSDDQFEVTLSVSDLGPENAVYQFASTAPGSYEVMDIGRYVSSFTALDSSGSEIAVERIATNQFKISKPEAVRRIQYAVADTWDTQVEGSPVMLMGGTSMENDHVLFNGNAVLGFPAGMQARQLRIRFDRPDEWMVGTALVSDREGRYLADDYDHIVDSPILLGRLTRASLDVRGSQVDIYTYSATGKVTSKMVLDATRDVLNAAGDFLRELPVERYTFLFHFGNPLGEYANDKGYVGAWEHSYSSEYILDEASFEDDLDDQIPNFVAHEFFHVVTPLNIHSEIIERFNFVTPAPSEHLWLYEGVTEWVAQTMQLRGGLIDLDEYLDRMSQKLMADDTYDASMSLSELSLQAYTEKGQQEYPNIYERGAVVGALLDLRLLELSDGKRGLREVLLELASEYGPERAFDDATFFQTFTDMTYPEIGQFFRNFVQGTEPLPIEEYFEKVGIRYAAEINTGQMAPMLGLQLGVPDGRIAVTGTDSLTEACGFRVSDAILSVNGEALDFSTAERLFTELAYLDAGVPFRMTVRRGDSEHTITCEKQLAEYVAHHVFVVDPSATEAQRALRDAWTRNLD